MNSNLQSRRTFLKSIGVYTSAVALTGCNKGSANLKPNIVWISCEDISPALGCYGDTYAVTPNLDNLAKEGIVYRHAFSTAPICSPSRSCLITGLYATSVGTQHLRSEIPVPDKIKTIPEYLRQAGYYCTNNSKTDYNFNPDNRWNDNSNQGHWRNRPDGAPFFSVFNFGTTHEGNANNNNEEIVKGLTTRHNPDDAVLPPYYPDTPEMRRIWARQYDLITAMDGQAGEIINQLKEDNLFDDTIIFFFADHGFGLPRYKRWLYNTGLQVPLVIRVPDKFRHLSPLAAGSEQNSMVSFVDFAPTVLNLAGVQRPAIMQGQPFLGAKISEPRELVYGARSRADDVYDVSRAVRSDKYIYIRNFMPHLPYIQNAIIFNDQKAAFKEVRRVRNTTGLPPAGEAMWIPKPLEELYDLENDPNELTNLAGNDQYRNTLQTMRTNLDDWILGSRDTGFLMEAEMMVRSTGSTPYEMVNDPKQYDLARILAAAKMVGDDSIPVERFIERLNDPDSGVRFWIVTALIAKGDSALSAVPALEALLNDDSQVVQITAAEALCYLLKCEKALPVLIRNLQDDTKPWMVLHAAMSLRKIGDKATPVLAEVNVEKAKYAGNVGGGYKDWLYPMFIGFALDQVRINCGEMVN